MQTSKTVTFNPSTVYDKAFNSLEPGDAFFSKTDTQRAFPFMVTTTPSLAVNLVTGEVSSFDNGHVVEFIPNLTVVATQ